MKQNTRKITEFFKSDYVDQASYDNLRKIASLVDGQKNAARKIIYTILQKNIKEKIKVSQLGSKVAEFAEYLHGNMDGVIVNLAI
jgi:DNA gyrase/topoisomerase IV subunit A